MPRKVGGRVELQTEGLTEYMHKEKCQTPTLRARHALLPPGRELEVYFLDSEQEGLHLGTSGRAEGKARLKVKNDGDSLFPPPPQAGI